MEWPRPIAHLRQVPRGVGRFVGRALNAFGCLGCVVWPGVLILASLMVTAARPWLTSTLRVVVGTLIALVAAYLAFVVLLIAWAFHTRREWNRARYSQSDSTPPDQSSDEEGSLP